MAIVPGPTRSGVARGTMARKLLISIRGWSLNEPGDELRPPAGEEWVAKMGSKGDS